VLDVGKPYSNTMGVVLPVVTSASDVVTPTGDNVTPGTIAFDSIRNCLRLMTAARGWTDCFLDEGGFKRETSNILSVGADFKIKAASLGSIHTLVIGKDDNAVYAAGSNANSRTGIGRTNGQCQTFIMVFGKPVLDVAAGDLHSATVDVTGRLWVWGSNANYRTGLPDTSEGATTILGSAGTTGTPTLVTLADHVTPIFSDDPSTSTYATCGEAIQCEAGLLNTYVLNHKGEVFSVGGYLAAGTGATSGNVATWTKVYLPGIAVSISASGNTCGAILDDGRVFVWGEGSDGRLGTNNTTDVFTPQQISIPGGVPIGKLSMGFRDGAAISVDGKHFYDWGTNRATGTGTNNGTIHGPMEMSMVGMDPATDIFTGVGCARYDYGNGGMTITTTKGIFTTGENGYYELGLGGTSNADHPEWTSPSATSIATGTVFLDAEMGSSHVILITGENPAYQDSSYVGYGIGRNAQRQLGALPASVRVPTQLTK